MLSCGMSKQTYQFVAVTNYLATIGVLQSMAGKGD